MHQLEPQTNTQPQRAQPQKKAYQSPTLRRYGDVTELTQTNAPTAPFIPSDGGVAQNLYPS